MRLNYKPIGDYVNLVEERNKELQDLPLIGLSITKQFIPSIANTIGTDMSTYRTIYKNQFAYSAVTSRNGDKLTIALFKDLDKGLISQAYTPFEVTDTNEVLPEYLMMWFSRLEFDRYARFKSHGSARELFNWEDLCESLMPIPSITKQKEIVAEYNTIQNRIAINKQLIQKLEQTAQAIYKNWFVDFEFPDENGQPYKTSGGQMVESELGEIPMGWEVSIIKDFCKEMKSGGTPSRDNLGFWNSQDIAWLKTGEVCNKVLVESQEYISFEGCKNSSAKKIPINTVLVAMYGEGKTKGQAGYLRFEATTNQACCAMICDDEYQSTLLYYFLRINQAEIANLANGGAQPNLSKELIENIKFIKPDKTIIKRHPFIKFINQSEIIEREIITLNKVQSLLLSKLATIEN